MKILVTGFEPFGPDAVNAAWEAVSRLPEAIGGAEIVKRRLPVEYEAGPARLEALVRSWPRTPSSLWDRRRAGRP